MRRGLSRGATASHKATEVSTIFQVKEANNKGFKSWLIFETKHYLLFYQKKTENNTTNQIKKKYTKYYVYKYIQIELQKKYLHIITPYNCTFLH